MMVFNSAIVMVSGSEHEIKPQATIIVPIDYPTIQSAIDNASVGDRIEVIAGTYFEHLKINKTISLVGENRLTTIIDGGGTGALVNISANSVNISGFTIRDWGLFWMNYGILLNNVNNSVIKDNILFSSSQKGIYLINSNQNIIEFNRVTDVYSGIDLESSSNNSIGFNDVWRNDYGIWMWNSCKNNDVYYNNISDSTWQALRLSWKAENNTVHENNLTNSGEDGLFISVDAKYNEVYNNNITENNDYGIHMWGCISNNITDNNISDNGYGFYIKEQSRYNNIFANNISDNIYGFYIENAPYENLIYHNNIINNTEQAYDFGTNIWNASYPSGGNYWSDYTGVDLNSTAAQNVPPPDGIGDTPYVDIQVPVFEVINETVHGPTFDGETGPIFLANGNVINISMYVDLAGSEWVPLEEGVDYIPNYVTGEIDTSPIEPFEVGWFFHAYYNYSLVEVQDNYPLMQPVVNGHVQRPPFRIDSNADFDLAHGVTGGSGTQGNPWIIENYDINGTGYGYCIYVGNTTEYFVVRNCYLHEASGVGSIPYFPDVALILYNVTNGTIINTNTSESQYGIALDYSSNNNITNCDITSNKGSGIYLGFSSFNNISYSNTISNGDTGIALDSASNNTIFNNTANYNSWNGMRLESSSNDNVIFNNTVSSSMLFQGLYMSASDNNNIYDNKFLNNNNNGFYLTGSDNNTIVNNNCSSNTNFNGISIVGSCDNNKIGNNTCNDNANSGIYVFDSNNNTIENNNCSDNINFDGISIVTSCDDTIIANNTCVNNRIGIGVWSSNRNVLRNNTCRENDNNGIYLSTSHNNTIENNNCPHSINFHGISIDSSDDNTIANNSCINNSVHGIGSWSSDRNIITNNTCKENGNHGIFFWNSKNNSILSSTTINNTFSGIVISSSDNNTLTKNNASNNQCGVFLSNSNHIEIINSSLTNNTADGLNIWQSNNCTVYLNNISYNNMSGIYHDNLYDSLIIDNNISFNEDGINLRESRNNTYSGNVISWNDRYGMDFGTNCDNNTINNNIISNNQFGIYIPPTARDNKIYHNSFINNINQAVDLTWGNNSWNNGYPSGGNYWSDYNGIDIYNGPNQDILGSDGIGDTPYTNIQGWAGNQDNYPLTEPVGGVPPTSSVDPISQYWHTTYPLTIAATASDVGSGVDNVTLWYRYSADNVSWGDWTDSGLVDNTPWDGVSWSFNFPDGDGYYEFYSIAMDNASNTEAALGTADASCGYDSTEPTIVSTTPPDEATDVSTAAGTYVIEFSEVMDTTVGMVTTDLPGVIWSWDAVGIWYNGTYTALEDSTTYTVNLPGGGFQDVTGNALTGDTVFDFTTVDFTVPTSSADPISPYWLVSSPLAITATASDPGSGIANVTLWYRHSPNNSTWTANKSFGLDTSTPWNWTFNFPDGEGYYEFYSIANDTANNTEATPGTVDALCAYDIRPPDMIDSSPTSGTTGESHIFQAVVTDNLSLAEVHVIYRFGTGTETNATMVHTTGDDYELEISIPLNSLETLHYRIVAVDRAGNWNSTAVKDVIINDNDDPVADAGPNQTVEEGTILTFNGSGSTDNIGITNYTWTFNDGLQNMTLYGVNPPHNFTVVGNFTVTLTVFDAAGNNGTDTMVVTANAQPPDNDGDGILDDTDTDDDNDGFLDEWEIFLGTNSTDSNDIPLDTDNDGIPDGDTNNTQSWMDTDDDDDGVSDSEDYDPLDPNISEPPEQPDDDGILAYWWIIAIIIIVIIISSLFVIRRKPEPVTELEPEPELETTLCPTCGFEIEAGSPCPFCVEETPEPSPETEPHPNQEILDKIEKAFQEGKLTEDQYQKNLEKFGK